MFAQTIYKSREILLEQMNNIGYDTEPHTVSSKFELDTMIKNNQLDMVIKNENTNTTMYVKYFIDKTIREQSLLSIVSELFDVTKKLRAPNDILRIVTKDTLNDIMKTAIKNIWSRKNIMVIIQSLHQLQFNALKHVLVPPHRVMSKDEVDAMVKQYNITNMTNSIPEISRFDPIARIIGIKPGEVCEIIQPSKTSIISMNYRICV